MKNILQSIFNFIINFFKKFSFKDWLLFISIIGMIILYMLYNNAQDQLLYNRNSYADTLTVYKNKLGEAYTAKNTYVQTVKDLKKTNAELYEEVKNLKDHPVVIVKTKTEFKKDTVYTQKDSINPVYHNDSLYYNLCWSANQEKQYYSFNGITKVKYDFSDFSTLIKDMKVNTGITLDLIDDGKQLRVITKSENPYINVNDINSVVIDPTKSKTLSKYFNRQHFIVGPYVGYGIGIHDNKLITTPTIGIGITYKIFGF